MVAGFAADPNVMVFKISDSFSKIMVFAVWASPSPPTGALGRPRAAQGGPKWVSEGSWGSPGGARRSS